MNFKKIGGGKLRCSPCKLGYERQVSLVRQLETFTARELILYLQHVHFMLKTLDDSTLEIPSEDKYLLCIFFLFFFPTVLLYPNIVNEKKN